MFLILWKSRQISSLSGTSNHGKHTSVPMFTVLMITSSHFYCVCMPKCIELLACDWVISYQSFKQATEHCAKNSGWFTNRIAFKLSITKRLLTKGSNQELHKTQWWVFWQDFCTKCFITALTCAIVCKSAALCKRSQIFNMFGCKVHPE